MHKWFKPLSLFWHAIILCALIVIGLIWVQSALKPANSQNLQTQVFIVRKGQTTESIGNDLKKAELIRSPIAFKVVVARFGLSRSLQAGSFNLSQSMTTKDIAVALTQGTLDVWVTILEGWRREEIAQELAQVFQGKSTPFSKEIFLEETISKEGYLFPDTYLIPLSASEADVAAILTNTFEQKITQEYASVINKSNFNLNEIITLASLIEREAKTDTARKMVAGILLNRLEIGMALQVDATLQYALGYNSIAGDWWTPPLARDKEIDSLHNTYKYPGLPPTPICSPSLSSITAAIYPTTSDYLYYITGNDGNMYYATTLEQHNSNVQTYLY